MNHETCRERLVELCYGELSRRDEAEVERHLAGCEPCRRERERLAQTRAAMRHLEVPPAPERGDAILLAAARRAAEERRRDSFGRALRSFSIRVAAGTAFAALAVFVVVQVRQGLRSPAEDVARERAAEQREPAPAASGPAAPPAAPPPAAAPARPPMAKAAPVAGPRAPSREGAAEAEGAPAASARLPSRDEAAPADLGAPPPISAPSERSQKRAAPSARALAGGPRGAAAEPYAARPAREPDGPTGAWARDVERRHAAGELSEAQKRFPPCPGGDVRRVAWIDAGQRVLKLLRERADGAVVEEWFDESGRLREALVRARAGGGAWTRHVTVSEQGQESSRDASDTGLAPEAPPPRLVRRDPSTAFFSGPGCAP